jgi:uncharacterized membrane protein YjjB (DUF3815 family)
MNTAGSQSEKRKNWRRLAARSLGGAAIGLVFGAMITADLQLSADVLGRAIVISAFAVALALLGAVVGARIIRAAGWAMFAGALAGGIVAILVTGFGKAVIFGVPLGAFVGVLLGSMVERRSKRPSIEVE